MKYSTRLETSLERKPDIALGLTTTVSQLDQRHTICQSKNNGKTSAPGKLSSHDSYVLEIALILDYFCHVYDYIK